MLARAGVPSEDLTVEGSTSKLMWLLAGFSSLWTVGLRVSVPSWLLAGVRPWYCSQCGILLHQAKEGKEFADKTEVRFYVMQLQKCHVIAFAVFEASTLFPELFSAATRHAGSLSPIPLKPAV